VPLHRRRLGRAPAAAAIATPPPLRRSTAADAAPMRRRDRPVARASNGAPRGPQPRAIAVRPRLPSTTSTRSTPAIRPAECNLDQRDLDQVDVGDARGRARPRPADRGRRRNRFHLNGVFFESDGSMCRMVSTDGHRLEVLADVAGAARAARARRPRPTTATAS
jgi:hypothetical protein